MPSAIDITKPIYGTPTTQSVRDNFTIARDEITDLQDMADTHVNRGGDTMNGPLILYGPPYQQNEATTLQWVLQQLHSTINALIYVGDYDAAADIILTSGQPTFVVGQPLPIAAPNNSQYYFTTKTGSSSQIGHQPPGGTPAGVWLISNGVNWTNFAMAAPGVTAQTVPINPPITNVFGSNVYDALVDIGQHYLMKSGGILTGDLTLHGPPTTALMPSTKKYVDDLIAGLVFPNEAPIDAFSYARGNSAWTHSPTFGQTIFRGDNWQQIQIDSTVAAMANQIVSTKSNIARWILNLGDQTTGVDFGIIRYDNSGNNLDTANGGYSVRINRLTGLLSVSHELFFDVAVSTYPQIFGRGANNPTDPTQDTFNIWSRFNLGGGVTSSTIGLRGPTFGYGGDLTRANSVEIFAGSASDKMWQFRQNGNFWTPGSIYIPIQSYIGLDQSGISYLTKDGANAVILWADAQNRFLYYPAGIQWSIQGPPNLRNVFTFHTDTGNLDMIGNLNVPGTGTFGAIYSGIIQSNTGRIVAQNAGNGASITLWDTTQGFAPGMFVGAGGYLYFGAMTGAGDYAGPLFGYFQGSSFYVPNGYIQSGGGLRCHDNGVIYLNVCANGFNQNWDGTYIHLRVDNTVDYPAAPVSDERMKSDIAFSEFDCLAAVMKTPLYQFRFRDGSDIKQLFTAEPMTNARMHPVGFVAQRQYEVFPESVIKGSDEIGDGIEGATNLWAMDSNALLATAFGAIKQLYKEVLELKGKLQ